MNLSVVRHASRDGGGYLVSFEGGEALLQPGLTQTPWTSSGSPLKSPGSARREEALEHSRFSRGGLPTRS